MHMISGALWGAGWNRCCRGLVRLRRDQLAPVAALHRDLRGLRVVVRQGTLALLLTAGLRRSRPRIPPRALLRVTALLFRG